MLYSRHAMKMSVARANVGRALIRPSVRSVPTFRCPPLRALATETNSSESKRPNFAPKPTIDVKAIRLEPELYAQNCYNRNYASQAADPQTIVELSEKLAVLRADALHLRKRNNKLRTQLSHSKTFSGIQEGESGREGDKEAALAEARSLKEQLSGIEDAERDLSDQIEELAAAQPNLTSSETPIGSQPALLGYINEQPSSVSSTDRIWRSHVHIGSELDILDFSAASTVSGWGWYYLKNEAALLEQALVQYAISVAYRRGFGIVTPPSMVYSHMASACGFRPRDQGGEQQIYAIQNGSPEGKKPELSLAGTAEIPFAAMRANTEFDENELPVCIVGSSRCYRAEAGSRGVNTKGLYRVHEFTKVEMFGWTAPTLESATTLFDQMVTAQKEILESLGLYCRILEQPSADLGASATRKQDIEAWFPSRQEREGGWGEVTSTSICTDYQSRRLATRIRVKGGGKAFPYTVNGTALAVPRVLAAILETHWRENEGTVTIPEVLWPWMHGIREIRKKRPIDTP